MTKKKEIYDITFLKRNILIYNINIKQSHYKFVIRIKQLSTIPYIFSTSDEDHSADTCCDVHQLETLEENVDILKMFLGRCSSCFQNVLNIFCDLTCSADQSNFINVTGTDHGINGEL